MSGGAFDYTQYKIREIADTIEQYIRDNDKDMGFSEQAIHKFKVAYVALRQAEVMAQRIDWLISGDDSEETFHERWKEDKYDLSAEFLGKDILI
jgi:hypothetical protein